MWTSVDVLASSICVRFGTPPDTVQAPSVNFKITYSALRES
jgi:hypothetical protein